jgi:hypothetical protein
VQLQTTLLTGERGVTAQQHAVSAAAVTAAVGGVEGAGPVDFIARIDLKKTNQAT